jgi:hypothetical protein
MKKREKLKPHTFRVCDKQGQTLNHVKLAATERPSDPYEVFVEKRRAEAEQKRQGWMSTVYPGESLVVVACDSQGHPL